MKTSNRLLVGFFVAFFVLVGLVQAMLYARYRSGHYLTANDLHHEDYVQYHQPAPAVLMLEGTIWVNLVPADSFYFEFPVHPQDDREAFFFVKNSPPDGKMLCYRRSGDTLFISGNNRIAIHRPFSDWLYRRDVPQVFVYGPGFREIGLSNGQAVLQGAPDSAGRRAARLTIRNSTLWVGEYHSETKTPAPEYFDSLEISADNSYVSLNRPARIDKLHLELADSSVLIEDHAILHQAGIFYDTGTLLQLTGGNVQNVDLHHHP